VRRAVHSGGIFLFVRAIALRDGACPFVPCSITLVISTLDQFVSILSTTTCLLLGRPVIRLSSRKASIETKLPMAADSNLPASTFLRSTIGS